MSRPQSMVSWLGRNPLPLILAAQAGLLFYRLDLLPIWGDEQFTLNLLHQPWEAALQTLARDIHPPLYYLLARLWTQLPLPGSELEQLRGLSAVAMLAASVAFYMLWLRKERSSNRWWFLALWTLSPVLVLYSRMARSYSLQVLVAVIAIRAAVDWLDAPARWPRLGYFALASSVLLWLHYLPGLALVAATGIVLLWRVRQSPGKAWPLAAALAAIGVLYLPWITVLLGAFGRVISSESYSLTGNLVTENALRIAYAAVAFTLGESPPGFLVALGVLLIPAAGWLLWWGRRDAGGWLPLIALAGGIALLGAAMWVSYPFTPARLLFLLPFLLLWFVRAAPRKPALGGAVCLALLIAAVVSLSSYYQRKDFLNQGYLVPWNEIARDVRADSAHTGLVIVDRYNTDPGPLLALLEEDQPQVVIEPRTSLKRVLRRIRSSRRDAIWYLRNTHDVSPNKVHAAIEADLNRTHDPHITYYLPYTAWQKILLEALLGRVSPSHYYQATRFVPRWDDKAPGEPKD